jgi:hypothetical protein
MTVGSGLLVSRPHTTRNRPCQQGHARTDHVYKDMWQTMSARLRQQGHVAQSDNDKCQVDLAFQVRENHKSE